MKEGSHQLGVGLGLEILILIWLGRKPLNLSLLYGGDFSPSKKQTLLAVSASMKEDLKRAASANAAEQDLDAFKTRVFGIKTASDRWMRSKVEAFRKEGLGLLTHWLTYGAGKWKGRTFFQSLPLGEQTPVYLERDRFFPLFECSIEWSYCWRKRQVFELQCVLYLFPLKAGWLTSINSSYGITSRLWQFMFWDIFGGQVTCYINDRVPPAIQGGGQAQGKFFHRFRFDVCGEARGCRFLF